MSSENNEASVVEESFLQDVFQHQALIHKICRMYRETAEDREDLFQEITYQLWKSYPKFQAKSKITSWMYRIGLNTAMASFRKPKLPLQFTATVPENASVGESDAGPSREEVLFAAIRKLEEADRALVALYLEEMSYAEIADLMGISENNVGVRLNRIKKKLKELLTEKDGIRRL
ncbi:RNA polymerase sigma factor [Cesiribacter sp. SM1]|uniref:RNA polymerase sigma factor n=1 Tax=Cesiribacter sp. SM1 TaxID=2861196 RepID=UPI001CD5E692|nr:sigma-70 family RNA polymerase sigma factor [Cesiribacter sp. SM1]